MSALAPLFCGILVALHLIPRPTFTVRFVADPSGQGDNGGRAHLYRRRAWLRQMGVFSLSGRPDEIVQLSLMPDGRLARAAIEPSIRQLDETFAHFWIRKGAVVWCADSGSRHSRREA